MTTKDILTRLHNGETIDDIAKELSKILQDASDAYEQEAQKKNKDADAADLADHINTFIYAYYPEHDSLGTLTGEDVISLIDTAVAALDVFSNLPDYFGKKG